MFLKTALTFLLVGVLSVNALTIPVARSPAPEPESQELDAWMLKRDLSYELFSREPEDWVEWAKREPSTVQLVVRQTPASRVPAGAVAAPWAPPGGWGTPPPSPGINRTPTVPASPPGFTPPSPGARPASPPPLNLGPVYGTGGVTIPLRQPR